MVVDPQTLETQGQETERTIVKWNFREENQKKMNSPLFLSE
jgi:hypothetical protein